jgi:rhodanese-related sulfurtransferase
MTKLDKDPKKLNKLIIPIFIITSLLNTSCQKKIPKKFQNRHSDFDKMVMKYLRFDVPTITIDEIDPNKEYLFIDCRQPEEYEISTIKGAINVTTGTFQEQLLNNYEKDTPIIVFCSIGYRSEKLTKTLIKHGYKNTNNLYGSIFEWANRDLPLYRKNNITTDIHTYNRRWSTWITNKHLNKTW